MEVTVSDISEIQETATLANKASISYPIFPTVYLDADVKFVSGTGTVDDPFRIGF